MDHTKLDLSVIIPSYKPKNLNEVIRALIPLNPLEIIVADSSPEKIEIQKDDLIKVKYLSERAMPGAARNAGAERARGEYLLFVDADVEFTEKTINFVRGFLAKEPSAIAWGVYSIDPERQNFITTLQNRILRYRFVTMFEHKKGGYGQSSHFIITKSLFKELGGFDPNLRMREDTDLCIRATHYGKENVTFEEFEANHLKPFNFSSLIRDYLERTFYAVQVKFKTPGVFRRVSSQIGWKFGISWILGALIPVWLIAALFSFLSTGTVTLIILATLLSPLLLCREVLDQLNFYEKFQALMVWPFIGTAMSTSTVVASVVSIALRGKIKCIAAIDWGRALFRILTKNGMPIQIVNFITSRCNLRCDHCFYKGSLDAPDPGEQGLSIIDKNTKEIGPVLWYALGGGEPFIRKDLPTLSKIVQKNCRPKLFTIPTNGWYTQRTFDATLRMLQQMNQGTLIIQFSVDGPEKMHDKIRGPGSWQKVKKSFEKLRPLRDLYPNLQLAVITVVTPQNEHIYPDFIDELVHDLKPNQVNINLFRHGYLGHPPIPESTIETYKKAVERYEELVREGNLQKFTFFGGRAMRVKEVLQKELIYRVAKFDEFVTPCTAGTYSYTIWEDGRVAPCEILSDTIGNLIGEDAEQTFQQMVESSKAKTLRKRIKDEKCKCTYECAMSTNTFFSWPMTKKMIKGVLTSKV